MRNSGRALLGLLLQWEGAVTSHSALPTPLYSEQGASAAPAFAPRSSEGTVGFLAFCVLLFIICLNCTNSRQLETIRNYLSLIIHLYFVAEGDIYRDSSSATKCPSLQPVSNGYRKCEIVYVCVCVCVCVCVYVIHTYVMCIYVTHICNVYICYTHM